MSVASNPASLAVPVVGKISRRILPFVFILYVIAYLDRANIAFAKLTMTADLGFSEAVFGLGAGLFYAGYILLEIPGALIVERWSARRWLARILITWGLCTVLLGFVRTPGQFYAGRFLLGAAEAGFFPGIIVYLNHWFPRAHRARALAGFILAIPLSLVVGAPFSGLLLGVDWLGMEGWRWLFVLEGLPAIVFGILTLRVLVDRPRQAPWLRPEERAWLEEELERERRDKAARGHLTVLQALRKPSVILLALALFFANVGVVGYILWLPATIQQSSGLSPGWSAAYAALPFAAGMGSVVVFGRSSDRTGERVFHTCIPMLLSGILFAASALPDLSFGGRLVLLCLTGVAVYAWAPPFWVLPTLTMGESAAAAAIGFINSVGNLGGLAGPVIVGYLLAAGYDFSWAAAVLGVSFAAGALFTYAAAVRRSGHSLVNEVT